MTALSVLIELRANEVEDSKAVDRPHLVDVPFDAADGLACEAEKVYVTGTDM